MDNSKRNALVLTIIVCVLLLGTIWFVFFSRITPPDFSSYAAGPERKQVFFEYFSPIITQLNQEILHEREEVKKHCTGAMKNEAKLSHLADKYRVEEDDLKDTSLCSLLLSRVDIIPASLALAQAANESAWGTSRFAQEGNNFFGQWCFKKGCGIVPNDRNDGADHEVAWFRSPTDSVKSYMRNLNTHYAYKELRAKRAALRENNEKINGIALSHTLDSYSERGAAYGEELRSMIRFNDLVQYD